MIVRVILLLLGLVSGALLAAAGYYGVFGSSASKPQAAAAPTPPPPQTMVMVAAKAIPSGTLIVPQDLSFAPIQPNQITAADYVRPKAANPDQQGMADRKVFDEVAGAVTRVRFDAGAPLQRGTVVKPGDAGFLAAVLQPGMRAVTIGVNVVSGAAGLVHPGDHVDVLLTQLFPGHETDPGNRSVSETIATDLRVVAVDQRVQAGNPPAKENHPAQTVTLECTPLQAEQIDVGTKMGDLSLSIRGLQPAPLSGGIEANNTPPGVWARDVSPAAAEVHPPEGKNGATKPQLRVLRGAKVENVVLP